MTDSDGIDIGSMRVWFEHLARLDTTPTADRAKLAEIVKLCEAHEAQRLALHAWLRAGGGKLVDAPAFTAMGRIHREIRRAVATLPVIYLGSVSNDGTRH